jgi:hypothetical protein
VTGLSIDCSLCTSQITFTCWSAGTAEESTMVATERRRAPASAPHAD